MKRQRDRDSPVKIKRSANPNPIMSRYDDPSRDRTPDRRERRGANKSPSDRRGGRPRDSSLERGIPPNRVGPPPRSDMYDDYSRVLKSDRSAFIYKILCVTNLNHKVPDITQRNELMREFERFGDVSVKIVHEANDTVAYVYFRTYDQAREARHSKNNLVLFDKVVQIEPIFDRSQSRRNRSLTPEYGPHPPRPVSPAHSNASVNSLGRRSATGRHDSLESNVALPFPGHHRDPPLRRGEVRGEFHPPGAGRVHQAREDAKKEKFPNYLHHVPPEEDDKATRTLFIGNLEVTISEAELRRIFERYGVVEDIDVKRPPPGQGNAYAFIKFLNLDMAHRAKVEMSGQYIGKFQCKIGYGKATPTTRIWVGGLGPWTSLSHLEREFDRFGAIRKIDFVKGDNHAYIQYDSIDAAQAACQEMRGFPLGGPDKRLRVDFADPGPYSYYQSPGRGGAAAGAGGGGQSFREEAAENFPPPPRRPRDMPASEDPHFFPGTDNHWPRSTYPGPPFEPHYDRPPRGHGREPWQPPEHEDRRGGNGDFRGGWNRDRPSWWDDHNHGGGRGEGGMGDRRKRPRTPEGDGHLDRPSIPIGDPDYKRPRRSHTPEIAEHDVKTVINVKELNSPHRLRNNNNNRHLSKERHSPGNDGNSQVDSGKAGKDADGGGGHESSTIKSKKEDRKHSGGGKESSLMVAENVTNIQDLSKCCPMVWHGGLVLKVSSFPARMHICVGDLGLIDTLMKDRGNDVTTLRITQRLRLDQPKLEDVSRKITNAGPHGHSILLAMAGPVLTTEDQSNTVQQRPLRNLVSYLKQKDAAGVISLPASNSKSESKSEAAGMLYVFPPCAFSLELLHRVAPQLPGDSFKDDHLVIVVVKGST